MSITTSQLENSHSRISPSSQSNRNQVEPESDLIQLEFDDLAPDNAATVVPDGGYGWVVVFVCSVITFWFNGMSGSWGIIQTTLLSSTLTDITTSTTAFVGSLSITICVAFGLMAVRLMRLIGIRYVATLGISLLGIGTLTSGFTTTNIAGLFQTFSVLFGAGSCLCYTASNVIPTQYFSRRLGLANALVKLGGGLGATILSVSLNSLINAVGIDWMFRIIGKMALATGIPAALAMKEHNPLSNAPVVDFALFKNIPFTVVFLAAATLVFTLFVPPFFLPLFAQSIGLSSNVGAGLVAGFSACATVGRFVAGPLCDFIGPLNTFTIMVVLNAVTTLVIWSVSPTLPPLIAFATLNGISNGAFFTTLPTVIVSMVDPSRTAVGMSLSITGWTAGYLLGTPIAGYLLEASGGARNGYHGVDAYRPVIFYAGGLATVSSGLVLVARLVMERKLLKKV
ncbi:hypothetical protein DV736_g6629, partial [Chaetothyriales sp. CBS 134916]